MLRGFPFIGTPVNLPGTPARCRGHQPPVDSRAPSGGTDAPRNSRMAQYLHFSWRLPIISLRPSQEGVGGGIPRNVPRPSHIDVVLPRKRS